MPFVRYLGRACAVSSVLAASALATVFPVRCDDHWWHMLTGRLLLERGVIPRIDPISFTRRGGAWVNWEWASGVAMFAAFDGLGGAGLVLLRYAAVAATLLVLLHHFRSMTARPPAVAPLAALLLTGLCVLVLFGRVGDRPHVYSWPLLASAHWLSVDAARRRDARPVVVLLGLVVVWVVVHPSWLLGVAVNGAVLAGSCWCQPASQRPRGSLLNRWIYRASPALLLLPALLLHSLSAYATSFASLFRASDLREWQPLWSYLQLDNLPLAAFLVLALLWAISLLKRPTTLRAPMTWLLAALLVASFVFVRFTAPFAILAAPALYEAAVQRWRTGGPPARTALLASILAALTTILALVYARVVYRYDFTAAVDRRANPVDATAFMASHDVGGNVLCTELNANAYVALLRYPQVHTFIDGRVPQVYSAAFLAEYTSAMASPDRFVRLIDRYGVDQVVLLEMLSRRSTALAARLQSQGNFALIYFNAHHMVWSRREALQSMPEPLPEFRLLIPPLIDEHWFEQALRPANFSRVRDELDVLLRRQPRSIIGLTVGHDLLLHPAATDQQRSDIFELLSRETSPSNEPGSTE